jgi:hypothetical protein
MKARRSKQRSDLKPAFISAYEAGVNLTRYCVCAAVLQLNYDFRLTGIVGYTVK